MRLMISLALISSAVVVVAAAHRTQETRSTRINEVITLRGMTKGDSKQKVDFQVVGWTMSPAGFGGAFTLNATDGSWGFSQAEAVRVEDANGQHYIVTASAGKYWSTVTGELVEKPASCTMMIAVDGFAHKREKGKKGQPEIHFQLTDTTKEQTPIEFSEVDLPFSGKRVVTRLT